MTLSTQDRAQHQVYRTATARSDSKRIRYPNSLKMRVVTLSSRFLYSDSQLIHHSSTTCEVIEMQHDVVWFMTWFYVKPPNQEDFHKKGTKNHQYPYFCNHVFPGRLLPRRSIDVTDVSLHFGNLQLTNEI